MNIARSDMIDGWMQYGELEWLAKQAETHKFIVEIGSYKGRSTRALADNTAGVVVAIDHWRGEAHLDIAEEDREKLYTTFCSNMQDLIDSKKVLPLRVDHSAITDSAFKFDDKHADMVFIDGSHTYEDVKRDINFWFDILIPGGLLCGHDSGHEPVSKAVFERFPQAELIDKTTIWQVQK